MADDDSYPIQADSSGGSPVSPPPGTLGRIPLKKVSSAQARPGKKRKNGEASSARESGRPISPRDPTPIREMRRSDNPMNRLVPYLDLFQRLDDAELARLGGVAVQVAADLRKQVDDICRALAPYEDLLPRLTDEELVRLVGGSPKTIRFWRLCHQPAGGSEPGASSSARMECSAVASGDESPSEASSPGHIPVGTDPEDMAAAQE